MKHAKKILVIAAVAALLGALNSSRGSGTNATSIVSFTTISGTSGSSGTNANSGVTVSSNIPEYVGPFTNNAAPWANIKTTYGAKGDGVTDDTAAFSNALANIGQPGHSPCLFIPAGTYIISQTIHLQTRMYIIIQGADPATTTLRWKGAANGSMFWPDGVTMARYTRLTFDANNISGVICADQERQGYYFDTNILYEDCIFKNGAVGIRAGYNGLAGSAETTVNRCQFYNMTQAGVLTSQFNALDWWIWDCLFTNCYMGVSNQPGAGSFYVFHSTFKSSTFADLYVVSSGYFEFRDNYSTNSAQFLNVPLNGVNGGPITLRSNTVVNCQNPIAIEFDQPGPLIMIDNTIASSPGTTGTVVNCNTGQQSDIFSLSNIFTSTSAMPMVVTNTGTGGFRWHNFDETIQVPRSSVNPIEPPLAAFATNYNRQVIEVATNANDTAIQAAINSAVAYQGSKPIIHIPQGSHQIIHTLNIPANLDVQFAGDGYFSILQWWGQNNTGPLLLLTGPTKATFRDLMISGNDNLCTSLITITNANQVGGSVFAEGLRTDRGYNQNININMGTNTVCEFRSLINENTTANPASTGTSVNVSSARVRISGSAAANNYITWNASNNARLCVEAAYYESGDSKMAILTGSSTVTFMSCKYDNVSPEFAPTFIVNNYNGTCVLGGTKLSQTILAEGTGSGKFWSTGNHAYPMANTNIVENLFSDQSSGMDNAHTNPRWSTTSNSLQAPEVEAANLTQSYARQMLAHLRSESYCVPTNSAPGITDFRMYRVYMDNAYVDLNILGGQ